MTAEKVQKQIYISGRVQGVGFRAFIRRQAAEFKIKGWAKNLTDGRVEAVIEGKKENIKQMIKQLKRGPSFAKVENVEINNKSLSHFNDFEIKF